MERVYLDNAATTPLDPEVLDAMLPMMREFYGNPSSQHAHGRKVKSAIEGARINIAKLLNISPSEIVFTSGGTEADNMALRNSIESAGIKTIITSPIEHHAVIHTAEILEHDGVVKLKLVELKSDGHVDLAHLELLLQENQNSLVALMHGNNEVGNMLDLKKVSDLCKKYSALFHTDAVQTMGHYPMDFAELGIDYLACSAHKFNGPKGIGFLYINKKNKLKPLITGGSQERNMRGGTENTYGIVGLAKALEICYRDMDKKQTHIKGLKKLMKELLIENIPNIMFNGDSSDDALYTVLSASFPYDENGDMLLFNLDLGNISVSGGSACSSGSNQGSHVLKALGVDDKRTNIRFSFGKFNTEDDIRRTVDCLKQYYPAAVKA